MYDGALLAENGKVIVVTLNYRLGALGFLAHSSLRHESSTNSSGNYGIQDCISALKWVKKNIQHFGGNPKSVTIFGESAGAMIISILTIIPETKGLFDRAILQSPAMLLPVTNEQAELTGDLYVETLGCNLKTDEETLECLRSKDFIEATENLAEIRRLLLFNTGRDKPAWIPITDGNLVKITPREAFGKNKMNNLTIMIGFNQNEASLFFFLSFMFYSDISPEFYESIIKNSFPQEIVPKILEKYPSNSNSLKSNLIDLATDVLFIHYVKIFITGAINSGLSAYLYQFSRTPTMSSLGFSGLNATHAEEINSIFRNKKFNSKEDDLLSQNIQKYWAAFAHTGNPNSWSVLGYQNPVVEWPLYQKPSYKSINFNIPITIDEDVRKEYLEFWDELYPKGVDAVTTEWTDDEPLLSFFLNVGLIRAILFGRKYKTILGISLISFVIYCFYGRSSKKKKEQKKIEKKENKTEEKKEK